MKISEYMLAHKELIRLEIVFNSPMREPGELTFIIQLKDVPGGFCIVDKVTDPEIPQEKLDEMKRALAKRDTGKFTRMVTGQQFARPKG